MAQSSRGMMHLQYAHITCTSSLRDGKSFRAIDPMIHRHNAETLRQFWSREAAEKLSGNSDLLLLYLPNSRVAIFALNNKPN
jgi:hypothetical protein